MRKAVSIVFMLLALLFAYVTLTVPAFEATAPALLTIACAFGAWFAWPKSRIGTS